LTHRPEEPGHAVYTAQPNSPFLTGPSPLGGRNALSRMAPRADSSSFATWHSGRASLANMQSSRLMLGRHAFAACARTEAKCRRLIVRLIQYGTGGRPAADAFARGTVLLNPAASKCARKQGRSAPCHRASRGETHSCRRIRAGDHALLDPAGTVTSHRTPATLTPGASRGGNMASDAHARGTMLLDPAGTDDPAPNTHERTGRQETSRGGNKAADA